MNISPRNLIQEPRMHLFIYLFTYLFMFEMYLLFSSSYGYRFVSNVTLNETYESLLLVHASGSSMFGGDSLNVRVDIDRRTCWYLGIKVCNDFIV